MKTRKIQKTVLNYIKNNGINLAFEYDTNRITILESIKNYLLEFTIKYSIDKKNYVPQSRENPESYDVEFTPLSINDVSVYYKDRLVELTNEQTLELQKALEINIV